MSHEKKRMIVDFSLFCAYRSFPHSSLSFALLYSFISFIKTDITLTHAHTCRLLKESEMERGGHIAVLVDLMCLVFCVDERFFSGFWNFSTVTYRRENKFNRNSFFLQFQEVFFLRFSHIISSVLMKE